MKWNAGWMQKEEKKPDFVYEKLALQNDTI